MKPPVSGEPTMITFSGRRHRIGEEKPYTNTWNHGKTFFTAACNSSIVMETHDQDRPEVGLCKRCFCVLKVSS
jgi:hypothetical protein